MPWGLGPRFLSIYLTFDWWIFDGILVALKNSLHGVSAHMIIRGEKTGCESSKLIMWYGAHEKD
jgi:hypothetical protein